MLDHAIQLQQGGRLAEAERLYCEALEADPRNSVAKYFLGVIALQRGQPERALGYIREAIEIDPTVPDYYANLGVALRALNQRTDAAQAYQRAIALGAAFPEVI